MEREQELEQDLERELESKQAKPTKPTPMLESHLVPQLELELDLTLVSE